MNSTIWPEGLICYKSTPVFDQDNTPAALQKAHNTKDGTWAKIKVQSGRLRYVIEDTRQAQLLDDKTDGIIVPLQLHHVEIIEPVRFYVEFYHVSN